MTEQTKDMPVAWHVTGCSRIYWTAEDAAAEVKQCGGSTKAFPVYAAAQPVADLRPDPKAVPVPQPKWPSAQPVAYQFQSRYGTWSPFLSDKHHMDTAEDGSWPIRALYTAAQLVEVQRVDQDRLLSALERATSAESALRALVDECEHENRPGWEDRMITHIDHANKLLAAHGTGTEVGAA